jgi:serine phosphatase RsbU (regulator of sigma subunit)
VAASQPGDVYRLATYLTSGLRSYLIRDANGDFMFLIHAVIVGAVKQVEADRERLVAEKLRREIDSVRQLQESIIPQQISCPENYSIAARYESSQIRVIGGQPVTMAGGDYYDAFTLPDDSVIVLVGDASGHGMKACMSIMTMHTIIRTDSL